MDITLKAFFPEKKNYTEFIYFLKEQKVQFESEYEYPEYSIRLNTTKEILEQIYKQFGYYIFAEDDQTLLEALYEVIRQTNVTISGAESCTGGLISKYLTDKEGASEYFKYSVVSYSNESKIGILNVDKEKIEEKGVVSKAAVIGMLEGLEYIYPTDISYAVSGIAGPAGEHDEKPVGTVFIGIMQYGRRDVQSFLFEGDRWEVRRYAAWTVLLMILNKIKNDM